MNKKNTVLWVVASCIVLVGACVVYLHHKKEVIRLKEDTKLLAVKNKQLKEKLTLCETTCKDPICHAGGDYQGDIRYIDCGESFAERWATCLCTTMCLEDFTITVTNRERCRNWPSVPIQIRPEPDEEEEDEEEN